MWKIEKLAGEHRNSLLNGGIQEYQIISGEVPLSFYDYLILLAEDESFRNFWNSVLSEMPYDAFRWESPALSENIKDKDYRFVIINSPDLERNIDKTTFEEYFLDFDDVAAFSNLGKDARLIIPTLSSGGLEYGHLASFVRNAPKPVVDKLWKKVGQEVLKCLGEKYIWLSTAGGGVSWLHVRIDTRPSTIVTSLTKHLISLFKQLLALRRYSSNTPIIKPLYPKWSGGIRCRLW